jgi:peptidoglycan/xylan/chitin deacetylase (PgdA/CDA1 family)
MNMVFVALTFDDGTLHQYHIAKLLYRYGVRGTFFCTTHLDRHPNTGKQLIVTDSKKLWELHHMGHEIASHTCTHPDLRYISSIKLREELYLSKEKLENVIEDEVVGFAYPYSLYTDETIEEVEKIYDYARGGTIHNDPFNLHTRDKYRISSIGVKKAMTLPLRFIHKNMGSALIVIMVHDISIDILLAFIYYLKVMLKSRFVTMKEISNIIVDR